MDILIADDDEFSRQLLAAALKKQGHEVAQAANGREAWEMYRAVQVQVLISDWMMPELDGLELCRLVRAEKRREYTYVILLTALEGKGSFLRGMEAGADDFITKPFDEEQLAARLRVAERILTLQEEKRQLGRLVPICSYCKKVREDQQYRDELDQYLMKHTDLQLSHGICPTCYETILKPEMEQLGIRLAVEEERKFLDR